MFQKWYLKKPRVAAAVVAVMAAVEVDDGGDCVSGAVGDGAAAAAAFVEEQPQALGYVQGRNLRCTWAE